jgi:hypothetical protein
LVEWSGGRGRSPLLAGQRRAQKKKMIVYRDIITGDEMLSDAFPLKQVVDEEGNAVEGLMYCESRNIQAGGDNVDIGCGNSFGGGGEDDAGADDTIQTVNNVIHSFQYTETQVGGANDFKSWIKEYMNAVRTKLRESGKQKEEIQAFMGTAPNIAKFLLKRFNDLQFYLGPAFDPTSMVFSLYPDGATTPCFYFIMGGYVQEKF